MSKLTFRTKKPKKGYIDYESFMTHQSNSIRDKLPPSETQSEAHKIVQQSMRELIKKLEILGYDQTRLAFSIHYLNQV